VLYVEFHCRFAFTLFFLPLSKARILPRKITSRTARKSQNNSTHNPQNRKNFDVQQSLRALEARVRHLETVIEKLDIDPFENALSIQIGKPAQKRGPKGMPDFELANRRDELILFFEMNWPELEPLGTPKPDFKGLKQAFEAFADPGFCPTPWGTQVRPLPPGTVGNHTAAAKRLLLSKTFSELRVFLTNQQRRFAANPRQLANAMAGCPELSFWTSLKRSQQIPFRFGINDRAMKSYIRRVHPRLYERISESSGLVEVATFWRKYRGKDQNISGLTADKLMALWEGGEFPR
jgi:hypothetical protein